jgi:hypothetical protein
MNKNPFISSSVLLMLALFIFMPARSFASKYVTVATIGSSPDLDRDQDPQKLVKQVIAFWDREL